MPERVQSEVEAARARLCAEWPEALFFGGLPPAVIMPSDGASEPPDLHRANRALQRWEETVRQLYGDAQVMVCEVDRLRRELAVLRRDPCIPPLELFQVREELRNQAARLFHWAVDDENYQRARMQLVEMVRLLGKDDPEVERCRQILVFLDPTNEGGKRGD